VNSHPSLLPMYRGPFPLAWAVRNGDADLGLTFHRMDADFDTGPILAQGSVPLGAEDWTMEDVGPRLAGLASELLPRALERIAAGDPGDPQPEEGASYAPLFDEEYACVDWSWPAADIHRQTRAWSFTFPRPGEPRGPIAELDGTQVRLLRTSLEERADAAARVECGDGPLWILAHEPVDEG
jgi:methionyl-tRNA formyltransferase